MGTSKEERQALADFFAALANREHAEDTVRTHGASFGRGEACKAAEGVYQTALRKAAEVFNAK